MLAYSALLLFPNLLLLSWIFRRVSIRSYLGGLYASDMPAAVRFPLCGLAVCVLLAWLCARQRRSEAGLEKGSYALTLLAAAGLTAAASVFVLGDGLLRSLLELAPGLAVLAAALGAGVRLLGLPLFGLRGERFGSPLEQSVLGGMLGLGVLSLAVFMLGSLGVLYRWFWWPLLALCCAAGGEPLRALFTGLRQSASTYAQRRGPVASAAAGLVLLWLLGHALLLWSPPLEYDVLEYHLALPAQYLAQGRVSFLPENIFSAFPANGEMLFLLASVLSGGDKLGALPSAHLMVLAAWAMTLAGVYVLVQRLTKKFEPSPAAPLSVLLFALAPLATELYADFYAEHFQALFHMGAVLAGCVFLIEKRDGIRGRSAWLWLCGILTGLACGAKYTALLLTLIPVAGGIVLLCAAQGSFYEALQAGAVLAAGSAAALLPWWARNLAVASDPFYPLGQMLRRRLHGSGSEPDALDFFEAAVRPGKNSVSAFADAVRQVLPGLGERKSWVRNQEFGPQLLCFALPGFLAARTGPALLVVLVFAADAALWFCATYRYTRFLYPMLAPLAVIGGIGLARLWVIKPLRKIVLPACAAAVVLTGPVSAYLVWSLSTPGRITGAELPEDSARLQYHLQGNGRWFEGWRAVNALPGKCGVLFAGEAQTFYANRTPVYATVFNTSVLEEGLRRTQSARELAAYLSAQGITHVYFNYSEWLRLDASYALRKESEGRFFPAPLAVSERRPFLELLRFRQFGAYSATWPDGLYPAYLRAGLAEYARLEEFVRDYTRAVWDSGEEAGPLCELRRITGTR